MALASVVTQIHQRFAGPTLEIAFRAQPVSLAELLAAISATACSPEEFLREARSISRENARVLLVATIHRTMAYSSEIMSIEHARILSEAFIHELGPTAQFFSTCSPPSDDEQHISGWYHMITGHTFESVLYCVGEHEAVLLVAIDED